MTAIRRANSSSADADSSSHANNVRYAAPYTSRNENTFTSKLECVFIPESARLLAFAKSFACISWKLVLN